MLTKISKCFAQHAQCICKKLLSLSFEYFCEQLSTSEFLIIVHPRRTVRSSRFLAGIQFFAKGVRAEGGGGGGGNFHRVYRPRRLATIQLRSMKVSRGIYALRFCPVSRPAAKTMIHGPLFRHSGHAAPHARSRTPTEERGKGRRRKKKGGEKLRFILTR